jgi:hypothetical protein
VERGSLLLGRRRKPIRAPGVKDRFCGPGYKPSLRFSSPRLPANKAPVRRSLRMVLPNTDSLLMRLVASLMNSSVPGVALRLLVLKMPNFPS